MLIFTVNIAIWASSCEWYEVRHLDAHKHVYEPYTDTAVNFDFHGLAYISMMTTCMSANEIIKVHV